MEENPVTRLMMTLLGAGSIKAGTAPDLDIISHKISSAKKKIKGKYLLFSFAALFSIIIYLYLLDY
jgi:hypothetical protein